jgi:uncharacterized membrane protein YgcG
MHFSAARGGRLSIVGLLALLAVSLPAWVGIPPSPPPSWIHDDAGLLKPAELNELTLVREQLEKKSGTRLVVVTLADASGQSAKSIAVDTLNRWNAGRKSALLLVTLSPRELYIQPGTELAAVLDSETSSSICSGVIAPKLRSGERAAALRAGLEAIASRIVIAGDSPQSLAEARATANASGAVNTAAPARSSWASSETLAYAGYGGGVLALLAGILGVRQLLRRKCPECGSRMNKHSEVITPASYTAPGEGRHHFSCSDCGRTASELYFIAQLTESTSNSTTDWSSSSSSSSWPSSDSSSSSSSSSDGSGGGGSSW